MFIFTHSQRERSQKLLTLDSESVQHCTADDSPPLLAKLGSKLEVFPPWSPSATSSYILLHTPTRRMMHGERFVRLEALAIMKTWEFCYCTEWLHNTCSAFSPRQNHFQNFISDLLLPTTTPHNPKCRSILRIGHMYTDPRRDLPTLPSRQGCGANEFRLASILSSAKVDLARQTTILALSRPARLVRVSAP